MVGITVDPGAHVKDVVGSFVHLEAVDYAVITTGRYNALIEVLCRDRNELLEFVNDTLPERPGVTSAEVLPYLDLYYQIQQSQHPSLFRHHRHQLRTRAL